MTTLSFSLDAVSAWAPHHGDSEAWVNWAKNPTPLGDGVFEEKKLAQWVDPMLRRRSRKLSRAMLEVAGRLIPPELRAHIPSVFAHRYGETETTFPLLCDLAENHPISPMGFSLSVHNTASGIFSIAAANQSPTTSIAAGKNSFVMGLLTALTFVQSHDRCLFLIGDEKLSDIYTKDPCVLDETQHFYVVGLVLSKQGPHAAHLESLEGLQPQPTTNPATFPQPLQFLLALLRGKTQIDFNDDGFAYRLEFPPNLFRSAFRGAHAQQN